MTSPPRTVLVGKAPMGTVAQEVRIGPHRLLTDVGSGSGGDDLGPDPHELLDAALASCTALTLKLYARRKALALDDLQVSVSHEEKDGVYHMRREIRLDGALSESDRARLLDIANRCPVHRTL